MDLMRDKELIDQLVGFILFIYKMFLEVIGLITDEVRVTVKCDMSS